LKVEPVGAIGGEWLAFEDEDYASFSRSVVPERSISQGVEGVSMSSKRTTLVFSVVLFEKHAGSSRKGQGGGVGYAHGDRSSIPGAVTSEDNLTRRIYQ
jgi:hypothetical protein